MPRAISPMETPSCLASRIRVLMTPGDSFSRVPSAAIRSTCSPSKATRRNRSKASSATPMDRFSHRGKSLTTPYL